MNWKMMKKYGLKFIYLLIGKMVILFRPTLSLILFLLTARDGVGIANKRLSASKISK
jgi:hypothetical protein